MFMIDMNSKNSSTEFALYLTVGEARDMTQKLTELLSDPEANEHFHVYDEKEGTKSLSVSIVTDEKLKDPKRYTELEKRVFFDAEELGKGY